jgi:hypothetical protein
MVGDTVAIQIPESVSERDEGRAIGACEAALGGDHCGRLDEGFVADFTARVVESSASELTISLSLAGQDESVSVRVLKFSDEELDAFRWQSVGVVIGALVLSQPEAEPEKKAKLEPKEEEPQEAAQKPNPKPLRAEPQDERAPRPLPEVSQTDFASVDLGPLVASSYSGARVAGGVWLGTALRVVDPLFVVAQGDVSFSPENSDAAFLRTSSLGGSLGLGLRSLLGGSRFGLEVSARGAVQSLNVRANSGTTLGMATTVRWGGRAGGGVFWLPSSFLGVVLGADAGVLWPPLDVEIGAPEPERLSALFWGGYLGLRFRFNHLE